MSSIVSRVPSETIITSHYVEVKTADTTIKYSIPSRKKKPKVASQVTVYAQNATVYSQNATVNVKRIRPKVKEPVFGILGDVKAIKLIPPLAYPAFVWLMNQSYLIITDSGGVQEEAPSLGKPVLVLRDTTERPEAVDAGTVILVGTNREKIVAACNDLLGDSDKYQKMSALHNPYGDGMACQRIVDHMILLINKKK